MPPLLLIIELTLLVLLLPPSPALLPMLLQLEPARCRRCMTNLSTKTPFQALSEPTPAANSDEILQ